jgi:hypothetical protein
VSYWVTLTGAGPVPRFEEGGTYALGGTEDASLNVTYNYAEVYRLLGFSIRDLEDRKASETTAQLVALVEKLGTQQFDDYWAPTPGNAGHALSILLGWARQYPDGIWQVH